MTPQDAAAQRYMTERVLTASPAELTAMLFDACVGALKLAARLQESGDHVRAGQRLLKVQDIVLELRSTLNKDAGELADRLDALYTFAWRRLLDASVQRKSKPAREALDVVDPIRTAWREACVLVAV